LTPAGASSKSISHGPASASDASGVPSNNPIVGKHQLAELPRLAVGIQRHHVDEHEGFARHIVSAFRKLQPTT
jgi:hypothetical protein